MSGRFCEGDTVWTVVCTARILTQVKILHAFSFAGAWFYTVIIRTDPDPVLAIRQHGTVYADPEGRETAWGPSGHQGSGARL